MDFQTREQTLELIIRKALAGKPWRRSCLNAMHKFGISKSEIEEELVRRRELLGGKKKSGTKRPQGNLCKENAVINEPDSTDEIVMRFKLDLLKGSRYRIHIAQLLHEFNPLLYP